MSKKNSIRRDERIMQALSEHEQRNRQLLSAGRRKRGGIIVGAILLIIVASLAATDAGRLYLNRFTKTVLGVTESITDLQPERLVASEMDPASSGSTSYVPSETEPDKGNPPTQDDQVRMIRDKVVELVHRDSDKEVVAGIKAEVYALVRLLPVPYDRKRQLYRLIDAAVDPARNLTNEKGGLLRVFKDERFNFVSDNTLMVADGTVHITGINESLLIVDGDLSITNSRNNIILSSGDVKITHEQGGVVIANGKVNTSHARQTVFFAEDGVRTVHQHEIIDFGPGLFGALKRMARMLLR